MFSRRSLLSLFALLLLFGIVALARPVPEETAEFEKRQLVLVTALVTARATIVGIVADITSAYNAGDAVAVTSSLKRLVVTIDGVTATIGSTQIAAGTVAAVAVSVGAILTTVAPVLVLVGNLGPQVVVAVGGVVASVNGLLVGVKAVAFGVGPLVAAAVVGVAGLLSQLQIGVGILATI